MNAKLRALLWEEFRTGGVITGWCTGLAVLGLIGVRFFERNSSSWQYLEPEVMPIAVGSVVLTIFLLLYRLGNSGDLRGGFSGRILLLPVETWQAVGLIILTRATFVLAISAVMTVLTHTLFLNGPVTALILLFPALYLYIQTVDWLRGAQPVAALVGALLAPLGGFFIWIDMEITPGDLDTVSIPAAAAIIVLAMALVAGFVISVSSVRAARRGERYQGIFPLGLSALTVPTPGLPGPKGFTSPRWALFWWHLRNDVGLIPYYMLAAGLILLCVGLGVFLFLPDDQAFRFANAFSLLEWLPILILPVFAVCWGFFRGGVGIQRGVRPTLTEYLYPVSSADMALSRLTCYAVTLLFTWLMALVVSNLAFFLSDNGLPIDLYASAFADGETTWRELLESRLIIPILVLLLSWSALTVGTRLYAWLFGILILGWATMGTCYTYNHEPDVPVAIYIPLLFSMGCVIGIIVWTRRSAGLSWKQALCWLVPYFLAVIAGSSAGRVNFGGVLAGWALSLLIAVPMASLAWALKRGIIPRNHVIGCLVIWASVVIASYPFGYWILSGSDRVSLLFCAGLGGLVVMPYPALILDLHRRRHHEDTELSERERVLHASWNLSPTLRFALYAAAGVLGLFLLWLRWPAEPAYVEATRSKGLPATLPDLAAAYGPVDPNENGALEYLKLVKRQQVLERDWLRWTHTLSHDEQAYTRESQLAYGSLDLAPEQPVWKKDWELALKRRELVLAPLSDGIESVAAKEFPYSRYPIDLGSGNAVGLQHLGPLRQLARTQAMLAWMAAVEDDPEAFLRALAGVGPIGESLREEPILISQLVRIAIHEMGVAAAEQALNRTRFSEEQLQSLQAMFANALPPYEDGSIIVNGLVGERVMSTRLFNQQLQWNFGLNSGDWIAQETYLAYGNLVMVRCWDEMGKNTGYEMTPLLERLEAASNPQHILPFQMLVAIDRSREAEWRCRVSLGLVEVACALERYRLATSVLPTDLDELVPVYMEKLPIDPYREGQLPVSYRQDDEGGYVVYSWARDREDDQGESSLENPARRSSDAWHEGDWGLRVGNPALRDGPAITDDQPMEEESVVGRHKRGMRVAN